MKKIAAITMARNDEWFLNRWIAYYGRELGEENLYVYLDGTDQKAPGGAGRANVLAIPKLAHSRLRNDRARADYVSDRAAELFGRGYEIVIAADSDEFIAADPETGFGLAAYLSRMKIDGAASALGLDVAHNLAREKPFDDAKPFLAQRRFALIHSRMTKASIINRPLRWGSGWHRVRGKNFRIDPNLYLFHMGNADYGAVMAKLQSPDLLKGNWQNHYIRNRLRVIRVVSNARIRGFEAAVKAARLIQTIFRPLPAWNKPAMLGLNWVVEIPERFKKTGL